MDKRLAMETRFRRESNLLDLKTERAPQAILEKVESLIKLSEKDFKDFKITNDEYKSFCGEYYLKYECDKMEILFMNKCMYRLRFVQAFQKNNKGLFPCKECDSACDSGKCSCGPFCPNFSSASAAQLDRFNQLLDVDTGERFDISALEEEIAEVYDNNDEEEE